MKLIIFIIALLVYASSFSQIVTLTGIGSNFRTSIIESDTTISTINSITDVLLDSTIISWETSYDGEIDNLPIQYDIDFNKNIVAIYLYTGEVTYLNFLTIYKKSDSNFQIKFQASNSSSNINTGIIVNNRAGLYTEVKMDKTSNFSSFSVIDIKVINNVNIFIH